MPELGQSGLSAVIYAMSFYSFLEKEGDSGCLKSKSRAGNQLLAGMVYLSTHVWWVLFLFRLACTYIQWCTSVKARETRSQHHSGLTGLLLMFRWVEVSLFHTAVTPYITDELFALRQLLSCVEATSHVSFQVIFPVAVFHWLNWRWTW